MINNKPLLMVVEDDDEYRLSLIQSVILQDVFEMISFSNCEDARDYLQKKHYLVDMILLDHDFKEYGVGNQLFGLELLDIINKEWPDIPVVMMSGIKHFRGQVAIDSIKKMAVEFLDKPILNLQKLIDIYKSCANKKCLLDESIEDLKSKLDKFGYTTNNRKILERIHFAYESLKKQKERPVTIVGETGSGKTFLANFLSRLITFDEKKIKILHCGNLGQDVNSIKNILFGHIKGSFSGAIEKKEGLLSQAEIVILDDIHHLQREPQTILLEVIQERKFSRFGDENQKIDIKSRFIFTSTKTPKELLKEGFLEEFVNRISAEIIIIPPLKQRLEDVVSIINKIPQKNKFKNVKFDKPLIDRIIQNIISGEIKNIRELKSLIDDLIVHSNTNHITLQDLKKITTIKNEDANSSIKFNFFEISMNDGFNLENMIYKIRKEQIITALKQTKGNIKKASELLGYKNHNGLLHWIKKLEIDVKNFK